jgi:hypothetical protein
MVLLACPRIGRGSADQLQCSVMFVWVQHNQPTATHLVKVLRSWVLACFKCSGNPQTSPIHQIVLRDTSPLFRLRAVSLRRLCVEYLL